jgi:hypothetical protein
VTRWRWRIAAVAGGAWLVRRWWTHRASLTRAERVFERGKDAAGVLTETARELATPPGSEAPITRTDDLRCPICGDGVVADISFDEPPGSDPPRQDPAAREAVSYSCGHRVLGTTLAGADQERLDVERRRSEDTVAPPAPDAPSGGG